MRESLLQGQQLLERAIVLDPAFAQARALFSFLLFYECANFPENAVANLDRALGLAQQALTLDPQLADGSIALGAVYTQAGRNEEAIRALRRGVELAPNSDLAWDILGYAYHYAGLIDQAEAALHRAEILNPTSRRLRWLHARMLLYLDRTAEAIDEMRFAETMDHAKALAHLGKFLYYDGRMDEADRVFARAVQLNASQHEPAVSILAAYPPASRGERHRIDRAVLEQRPTDVFDGDQAYWIGGIFALLGEKETACTWLHRAVDLGNHNYTFFRRDRNYGRLRGDQEYEGILAGVRREWERYRQLFGR
jgi:tetratricopeptide (TPR) repeat protein